MEIGRNLAILMLLFSSSAHASLFEGELSSPSELHSLLSKEKSITVEVGVEYIHPSLPAIHDVVVENSATSTSVSPSGTPIKGDVDTSYPEIFAQTLKAQMLVNPDNDFTIAVKTYLPLNGLTQMDTGNIYQPEFALYRSEGQRPRILLTSGLNLNPDWRIGLGLDVGFSVSSQATVFLQSGAGTVSDQRISAKIKPSLVPQASLAYQNYRFTVRGENKANFDLTAQAGARVFSDVSAGLDFSYSSQSALFYQPWEFEFLAQTDLSSAVHLKYGVSYELWSGYQARAAVIKSDIPVSCPSGSTNCAPRFSSGQSPAFKARNLWVPEGGVAFDFDQNSLEFDYQYKDSIFTGLPTGTGNYLDPPRHDFQVEFTHHLLSGMNVEIHALVSRLTEQNVVKLSSTEIGAPGYLASGWLYGGGLSVAIPFKN